ncbi:MAG TPA: TetR/AcrR family transcriptional regulator [Syntrophorhabdales bacterium]|nr:TetR/AcrR family transcriptional regulator [Syntrophorhabdales bacterium]
MKKATENTKNLNRKSEIYRKTLDLFVKNGYDATSMSMIAETAGLSKANLYYYCSSKENLLYKIHLDFLQKHFDPIVAEAEKLRDPKERLEFVLRKFTLMCTSSQASQALVHDMRSLDKAHQEEITAMWRKGYELVRGAVEELQKSGAARKFRRSFLTFLGVGMAFWTIYWWDYSRQGNDEELAETLVQTFLYGLYGAGAKK